ncbi:MAG: mannose-1-phosphate guanylyltransferase [Bacteroidales bacterium]|nr:mannose-1-phosphate guanylyltransferase [Bacteroidales bacterium]
MAGGIGSRLWPVSTPQCPKQFIDITGSGRSLIQMTVDRFLPVAPIENFWVVTGAIYVSKVREQLPQIPESHILAEPEGRNTAPCIAYACRKVAKKAPSANVVVTPSDALVIDTEKFTSVIEKALEAVEGSSKIVTIGITPTRPETGYGYICAESLKQEEVVKVSEFREKPDLETAKKYLAAGNFFWNAGIFVWNVATINEQLQRYAPQITGVMDKIEPFLFTDKEEAALKEHFRECEKISIDYAVMEKSPDIYVIACEPQWSDLGTWVAVKEHTKADADGNCVVGDARLFDCKGCIVHVPGGSQIVLQGLRDSIVALKDGRLLVCQLSQDQAIKDMSKF